MKLILLCYPLSSGINNVILSKNQIGQIRHFVVTNLYLPFPYVRYLVYHSIYFLSSSMVYGH